MSEKETCALCGEPMCACDRSLVRELVKRCRRLESLLYQANKHVDHVGDHVLRDEIDAELEEI